MGLMLPVVHVQSNFPAALGDLHWAVGLTPISHGVCFLLGLVPETHLTASV